ncbi:hypothetical protein OS493_040314, partial [Desmophyllum pertusum]
PTLHATQLSREGVRQEVDEVLRGADPSSCQDLDKKLPYMEMVSYRKCQDESRFGAESARKKQRNPSLILADIRYKKG